MINVLVLAEKYPDTKGDISLMYIHTRNLFYKKNNINVTVLKFRSAENYTIDGINVITYDKYRNAPKKYDILIAHAPNLKHHYLFLKKFGQYFDKKIFFFHGHEVLMVNKVYSAPYNYLKRNKTKEFLQNQYDKLKLFIWHTYYPKVADTSYLIFVSNWMYREFLKWTRIREDQLKGHSYITYNCVGKKFEEYSFDSVCDKKYDFITIRLDLDVSKYAIDVVNRLAMNTPMGRFLVIGKGDYFKHNVKADNIELINHTMQHDDIISYLQKAKFALMPTRTDAQGLMMCEMAAFGIPVITSDIEVCHEVFDGFDNVYFIQNDKTENLNCFIYEETRCKKDMRYFEAETVGNEVKMIYRIFGSMK